MVGEAPDVADDGTHPSSSQAVPLGAAPVELDPHLTDLGPFYDSAGAMRQLGGLSELALDRARSAETVLAMQTQDGTRLYPAWQFTGDGHVHAMLVPVLAALRGLERWQAGPRGAGLPSQRRHRR